MVCPKCNSVLPDGSAFCTSCGQSLSAAAPSYAPTYAPAAPKKETATGNIFKNIFGSWVTLLIFILGCVWAGCELFSLINAMVNYNDSWVFFKMMESLGAMAGKALFTVALLILVGKIDNK